MTRQEHLERWFSQVAELDERYRHLTNKEYEEERADFYVYYLAKFTPEEALRQEYHDYG